MMELRRLHLAAVVSVVLTLAVYAVVWHERTYTIFSQRLSDLITGATTTRTLSPTNGGSRDMREAWRYDESMRLGNLVQNRLAHLQSPEMCNSTRTLVCNYHPCGFGCRMHSLAICLMVAYATQRTVVVVPAVSPHLQPLSAPCPGLHYQNAPKWNESTGADKVVKFNRRKNIYKPPFYPPALPKDLTTQMNHFHNNSFVWWAGHFAKYVFRPSPNTTIFLQEEERKLGISSPIIGVHVRRTDKLIADASLHSVDEYMVHVESWYNKLELTTPGVQRKVFLATDDPTVAPEITSKYPKYTFLYNGYFTSVADFKKRKTYDGELGIVHDIYMLSKCDFLVCTLSSNVCRLSYELIQTRHGDATKNLLTLDRPYNFPSKMPLAIKKGLSNVGTAEMPTYEEFDAKLPGSNG